MSSYEPRCHHESIQNSDGMTIKAYRYTPHRDMPSTHRERVLVVHGYLEHAGRYADFARHLGSFGWESICFDLRGHGFSDGRRGYIRSFYDYHRDLARVCDHFDAQHPSPWILIGHSLGGLIALDYLTTLPKREEHRWKTCIVSNPFLQSAMHVPAYKRFLGQALSRYWPTASLPAGIRPSDLTSDSVIQKRILNDSIILQRATARWFTETQKAQKRVLERRELFLPTYAIVGSADPIADPRTTQQWLAQLAESNRHTCETRIGDRHEVLSEKNRLSVFEDIRQWCADRSSENLAEQPTQGHPSSKH